MPRINVLPQSIAELIAAGEVVERPASVIKETVENSIDAGAKHITVEINRGGTVYMRVTDDGCGIESTDVPTAFLRHATSKIKTAADLDGILTLGFRGEALAATASVSKTEMFTKTKGALSGTHYVIEGGREILCEDAGCPDGTTIIIRDLFYNTPARMKFLKKDVSEGTAVMYVVERAALSHPEIAFKFIREGKVCLTTSGDGKLISAIYSVLGREFANSLIEVSGNLNGIGVGGYICKPVFCRPSKAMQFVFLNGRLVRSGTVSAAAEQAYKNSAMVGKYPAFVLNVTMPAGLVDVNVHPAKTEVRFSDEKRIFDAVYSAVKSALTNLDTRPVIKPAKQSVANRMSVEEYRQTVLKTDKREENESFESVIGKAAPQKVTRLTDVSVDYEPEVKIEQKPEKAPIRYYEAQVPEKTETPPVKQSAPKKEETKPAAESDGTFEDIIYIGEMFKTYIAVQKGDSVFLIDKHAAHERILFNKLKSSAETEVQQLLVPVTVRLEASQYLAVNENTELLKKAGIEAEDFGGGTVIIRAVPAMLKHEDVAAVIEEAAESLTARGSVQLEALDRIYHTVSCKAAIKAGGTNSSTELLNLAKKVLCDREVMYCPHGRPVAFELKKRDLEKHFGRIQ